MNTDAKPTRNRRRGWRLVVVLTLFALAIWAGFAVLDAALSPWARSLTGGATLTGRWQGSTRTASGRDMPMQLALTHPSRGRCNNCPTLEGEALVCERGHAARRYRISGHVREWSGARFEFKVEPLQARAAIELGHVDGAWTGDQLTLTTTLVEPGAATTTRLEVDTKGRETLTVIGGHVDTRTPLVFVMHRLRDDSRTLDEACERQAR